VLRITVGVCACMKSVQTLLYCTEACLECSARAATCAAAAAASLSMQVTSAAKLLTATAAAVGVVVVVAVVTVSSLLMHVLLKAEQQRCARAEALLLCSPRAALCCFASLIRSVCKTKQRINGASNGQSKVVNRC
jgi:hypothetical protein